MPNVTYPLDTTGLSPDNLVKDEPHVLSEINDTTYRIIIPDFSPFYQDNFSLRYIDGLGVETPLVKGVDFDFVLPYMTASRAIGKYLFGGLKINNSYLQGHLLVDYQTLGAEWVADKNYVLEQLVSNNYNPRVVYFDQLTNVQETFPPTPHAQDFDQIYGQRALIDAIDRVIAAILQGPDPMNNYLSHVQAIGNVHGLTIADLGIPAQATDQEVSEGQPLEKLITLRQLIQSGIIAKEAMSDQFAQRFQDLANEIEAARTSAVQEAVAQADAMIKARAASKELLTAAQYFMNAPMFVN